MDAHSETHHDSERYDECKTDDGPSDETKQQLTRESSVAGAETSQKQKEELLIALKGKRTAALSAITKKKKEITQLMESEDNLHLVKSSVDTYYDLIQRYGQTHAEFCRELQPDRRASEDENFKQKEGVARLFIDEAALWIRKVEMHMQDEMDHISERRSRSSAAFSRTSKVSIVRAHQKAKIAELMVERAMLKQKQAMKAQEEELQLEIELAKAQAREQAFTQEIEQHEGIDESVKVVPVTDPIEKRYEPTRLQTTANRELNPNAEVFEFQPNQLPAPMLPHTTSPLTAEQLLTLQKQHSDQVLYANKQLASAISLPQPELVKFKGDPIQYMTFIRAFDARIVALTNNDTDKLYYLEQNLEGEPRDLISGCLFMQPADGYVRARMLLEKEYGDPYKVSIAYLDKILSWQPIRADDNAGLRKLSFFLVKCQTAMSNIEHLSALNHAPNLQAIVMKLPQYLQRKWRDNASTIRIKNLTLATFSDLVSFVKIAAESANDPIYGKEAMSKYVKPLSHRNTDKNKPTSSSSNRNTSFAARVTVPARKDGSKSVTKDTDFKHKLCDLCNGNHDLDSCAAFNKKSIEERRSFLKDKRMCFGCYGYNHLSRGCTRKRTCKKCNKRHPTALHVDDFKSLQTKSNELESNSPQEDGTETENVQASATDTTCTTDTILHAILPVYVRQGGASNQVLTYAFYDNGSSGCFLTEELEKELAASGTQTTLQLRTMHGKTYEEAKAVTDLVVTDLEGMNQICLPKAYTMKDIPVNHQQIPTAEKISHWPHLQHLASHLPDYIPDVKIGLLIGSNCPSAHEPLKVVPMETEGPFAVQLRHGWTVNGPLHINGMTNDISCNRISFRDTQQVKEVIQPATVLKMFEHDFNENSPALPDEAGLSPEDRVFFKKIERCEKDPSGHFVIPLPFRDNSISMPTNRKQAESRAEWQKRKLKKNPKYYEDYVTFVQQMISKGYAMKVPEGNVAEAGQLWYLPHHGIYHHKKRDKIRVVFDCSARFAGTSLNDKLLQGPDLTNSLLGVLTRFREEEVVIIGDIEAMFHQVKVPSWQQDFLRFLWWPNGDLEKKLEEYRMTVHLFGAVSSPSIANYALQRTAEEGVAKYGLAVSNTVKRNFYVDDCLKSVVNEETAIDMYKKLCLLCAEGGFKLTKLTSNSQTVLASMPETDRIMSAKAHDFDYDELLIERALGIQWSPITDKFKFSVLAKTKPLTRRGILSLVSSVYDPIGLIAPFILPAKKLLQNLCKETSLGWDDEVPEDHKVRFVKWLDDLPLIDNVSVPRCLKPENFGAVISRQLHVFSDASSSGYGAVAYLRQENINGEIHCAFLMGKSRVTPIKSVTIPRLELTAAVASLKMGKKLEMELETRPDKVIFHVDSTTVLHFINCTNKRFPIFVSNRVQLIQNFSDPSQWKYVDTKDNPADIASRGLGGKQLAENRFWYNGPLFLQQDESEWPKQPTAFVHEVETDSNCCKASTAENSTDAVNKLFCHYSSLHRLKRAVAYLLRLKKYLYKRQNSVSMDMTTPLMVNELEEAETAIIKHVQAQYFGAELDKFKEVLKRGRATTKQSLRGSAVYRLDPFIDDLGVLRVGGRLRRAKTIPEHTKHQILLPPKGHVVNLLLRDIHVNLAHAGRNHTLAKLREKYWVIRSNAAVRRIINKCVPCRRQKTTTCTQKMADLPKDRTDCSPPFTYSAVDYFGPYFIKEGRKQHKRYGVLFTCLASRAIHLETAHSLDTDSFLHALRRFIARRGPVRQMRSDNGTNFVGAERELRQALQEMDQKQITQHLLSQNIDWIFNPPSASHMGGAWERQIRTVRKVLTHLVREHGNRLDEESFSTLLCEVECIVNSRPLTTLSDDPDDLTPLSPNMILTAKHQVLLSPPGQFERGDIYMRRRWRRVQYLANLFWTRWRREYLSTLQVRQKWQEESRNIKPGDVVLLTDENLPRNDWSMGRVELAEKDDQGRVRSAVVCTPNSKL